MLAYLLQSVSEHDASNAGANNEDMRACLWRNCRRHCDVKLRSWIGDSKRVLLGSWSYCSKKERERGTL